MNPTLNPTKRTLLRNLTILFPSLDWLWHGDTLRSEFIIAGYYRVEIHQYQGSAGPYEVVIDGNPLTWKETLGPYHLEGLQGNACFEHIGRATDAAFHRICDLRVQKGEITQKQALLMMYEAKRLFWKKVWRMRK